MKNTTLFLLFIVLLIGCKKNGSETIYDLQGHAQKGPFETGANVTIIELDENLSPTGRTFFSTIDNNAGHFSFPNVSLASRYIQLKVEGKVFDEITNAVQQMWGNTTLYSIVDVTNQSTINVNIITHLEHQRIFELVNNGASFSEARNQAQHELLAVFNLENYALDNPENLDITSSDVDDGILYAISVIVQANFASAMTFQEFITNLTTDFKNDGIINSTVLQKSLCSSAAAVNIPEINYNLWVKYNNMGLSFMPYNIQPLINEFVNTSSYPNLIDSVFPEVVNGRINILALPDTVVLNTSNDYCIAINDKPFDEIYGVGLTLISQDMTSFSETYPYWSSPDSTKQLSSEVNPDNVYIPITFNHAGSFRIVRLIGSNGGDWRFINMPKKYISWN